MRRLIIKALLAGIIAILFVFALTKYASTHERIPTHWPRVYIASNCPASEFALYVAEGAGKTLPLVTIPVDDGALAERACRHTQDLLVEESLVWSPLALIPDSLVCSRLILDGSSWMTRNRHNEWPVVVSPEGEVHLGADIQGLRTAGLHVSDEEFARMLEAFASARGEPQSSQNGTSGTIP
jgi:hypothetical protein